MPQGKPLIDWICGSLKRLPEALAVAGLQLLVCAQKRGSAAVKEQSDQWVGYGRCPGLIASFHQHPTGFDAVLLLQVQHLAVLRFDGDQVCAAVSTVSQQLIRADQNQ